MGLLDGPKSIVEMRCGEMKMILCNETPEEVEKMVNWCEERLVCLSRWLPSGTTEFRTRPDNIIAVRSNQ